MAFGWAGAGNAASQSLEEIVAQRLLRQKLEQEIRMQEAALEERRRSSMADEAARTRQINLQEREFNAATDARDAARRDKNNQLGVRRMMGDFISQGTGAFTPDDQRGIAALQVEAGQMPDINVPAAPKPPGTHVVDGNLVDDTGKVLFTAPKTPAKPEKPGTHVVGGALVDDTGRVIYTDPNKGAPGTPSPYSVERAQRTIAAVDELMGKVGMKTAGFGSLLAGVPATSARNFKAELDTLKSNIAFNELAQMREASKTGGALGQVSDREAQLLSSTLGALDAGQSPADLKANLQQIKESVQRWQHAHGAAQMPTPVPSHGGPSPTAPKRLRFDAQGNPIKP